ncbi:unnamed protein product, partial [Cladocopium goreaui]
TAFATEALQILSVPRHSGLFGPVAGLWDRFYSFLFGGATRAGKDGARPLVLKIEKDLEVRVPNPISKDTNSATITSYQFGVPSLADRLRFSLISGIIDRPVFQILRTEHQLGYVVFGFATAHVDILEVRILVQGFRETPDVVATLIDQTVKNLTQSFHQMSPKEFEVRKDSLRCDLKKPAANLGEFAGHFWSQIWDETYCFDKMDKELKLLDNITLPSLAKVWEETTQSLETRKKMTVKLFGSNPSSGEVAIPVQKDNASALVTDLEHLDFDDTEKLLVGLIAMSVSDREIRAAHCGWVEVQGFPALAHPPNKYDFARLGGPEVKRINSQAAEDWMKAHRPCDLWHDKQKAAKVKEIKTCLLDAGEVLYLPSQWRHGTCNVGEFSAGIGYIGAIDHLPKVTWLTALDDLSGLKEALKEKDDVMEALTVKDRDGKQPLHWAAHRGHQRMVRELLKMRALASATDRHGARPVHLAAFEGHEKALRELLEVETRKSATARTDGGAEPLHLAATKGHSSVAKLLLRKRASPSARDNKGAEPLHMAAYEGHVSMVDLLLAAGAAPDAGADDGTDPAKLAWTRGHKDLAHKLNDAIPKKSTSGRKTLGPLHDEF